MDAFAWVTGLLLVLLEDVRAEFCSSPSSYDDNMYCVYGCCGDYFDRYCCEDTYENIPLIVGSSVGGFFFIVIVIAAICACVKSANRPGRVIGVHSTFVATTAMSAQQGGYTTQMVQPPGYSAYPHPPPSYGMQPAPPPPNPPPVYSAN